MPSSPRRLGEIGYAEADDERERKAAVHQHFAEFAACRDVGVEMRRIGVHRDAGEPDVVGIGDRPPELVRIHVADVKIFKHTAPPSDDLRHYVDPFRARASNCCARASTGASIMRPSTTATPLAYCSIMASARATSSALGRNAARMTGTCRG